MYFAAIASSRQSFLSNSFSFRHSFKPKFSINLARPNSICCKSPHHDDETDSSRKNENQLAKLAIATLAVGVLALGCVGDASAAKSGGRIGGQAFRSSAPRPPPRINNRSSSRTNIYVNPQVAPPLIGGYGYGYGGYGWSPFSFFAPGPAVAVGVGGGFDLLLLFMFFGAASAVARNFFRSRNDDDEDDY